MLSNPQLVYFAQAASRYAKIMTTHVMRNLTDIHNKTLWMALLHGLVSLLLPSTMA